MKKIDKIAFATIIIAIVLLNIYIGSNIKEPIWIIQTIVSFIAFGYILIKKIQKEKNVIIKGKIDIAVLIFMISTILPLLFRKYSSLEGTINFILKYWSVFGIYVLTRNVVVNEQKIVIIIKTVLISSIIPIILGYDKILNLNIFSNVLESINAVKITDTRMISTFGYANTFAIYLTFTVSLAMGLLIQESNKKNKILLYIYIIIAFATIVLTQSKAVIALIGITILIFACKGIRNGKIKKKWIVAGMLAIAIFAVYFCVAIHISKTLVVTQKQKTCVIRNIEKNKKYNLKFNIDAVTNKDYDSFKIIVVEITRYFGEKQLGIISLGNYFGIESLDIETDEITSNLEIRIENPLNQTIKINEFKINNAPYILEYKIIPDELVRMFTTFNFKNSSVFQRFDFWNDGIKIIKDNWLIGAGGNAWRMLYGQYQDYLYYAKEVHSYPIEIWMSFGITGIVAYIFIIAITLQNINKNLKNKIILSIAIGLGLVTIHSFMDFDMSYLIMEMTVYIFLSIINKDDNNIKIKTNLIEMILIAIFGIVFAGNVLAFITTISENEQGISKINVAKWLSKYQYNEIILNQDYDVIKIKQFIKNEPYMYQNKMYEVMGKIIQRDCCKDDVDFLVGTLKNIKLERNYEVSEITKRAEILIAIYKNTDDKSEKLGTEKLLEIVVNEYPKYNKNIQQYQRNLEGKTIADIKYKNYAQTYIDAKKILEGYK